jgi:hypothetical protein
MATKDRPNSTRFDFSPDERARLEFLRRHRGERSAAATVRAMILEASEALGFEPAGVAPAPRPQPATESPKVPNPDLRRVREDAPAVAHVAHVDDVETTREWLLSWESSFDAHPKDGEDRIARLWREARNETVVLLADMAEGDDPYEIAQFATALGVTGEALRQALRDELPTCILAKDIEDGEVDLGWACCVVHHELHDWIRDVAPRD